MPKAKIHPKVKPVTFICSSGAKFALHSTIAEETVYAEYTSANHPHYTGEQKILKTGKVDKFAARMAAAAAKKEAAKAA